LKRAAFLLGDVRRDEEPPVKASPVLPAELVQQARLLDAQHRRANYGKPISRDNLKVGLSVATDKATALVHIIRAERDASPPAGPDDQRAAPDLPHAA
jgi:hypothetical protein